MMEMVLLVRRSVRNKSKKREFRMLDVEPVALKLDPVWRLFPCAYGGTAHKYCIGTALARVA
jgi:hypothetical protein